VYGSIYVGIRYCANHCGISGDYNNNNNNNNNTRLSEMDEGHHSVKYTCVYYSHNIILLLLLLLSSRISTFLLWCAPPRERFTGRPRSPQITEAVLPPPPHLHKQLYVDTRTSWLILGRYLHHTLHPKLTKLLFIWINNTVLHIGYLSRFIYYIFTYYGHNYDLRHLIDIYYLIII